MSKQHQISLLPAERQGVEGYEATADLYLVCVYPLFHPVDIHLPDAEIAVRNPL